MGSSLTTIGLPVALGIIMFGLGLALTPGDFGRIARNPKAVAPAAHTLFGFSRGRWEGTTLVVETDHIAAGYFDHEGTPQSDQIKTVERFIPNADYSRLDYILTTTDPVNFTKPFDLKRYFVWKPENRVHPYECLDRFQPDK